MTSLLVPFAELLERSSRMLFSGEDKATRKNDFEEKHWNDTETKPCLAFHCRLKRLKRWD